MSSCTTGRRKFTLNSDRIFLGIPGFALGFAIGEFVGKLSTSYAYIATGLLLGTSIFTALGVTIPITWRKNLNWFIIVLLIGNFVCSIFYLIIITQSEDTFNNMDNLPINSSNISEATITGSNLESIIESHNGTKNATHNDNPIPGTISPRSYTQGLKSSIAFIVLGVLLILNSLAAVVVNVDTTNQVADTELSVPVNESELKPLDKKENETVDNDNNESNAPGGIA